MLYDPKWDAIWTTKNFAAWLATKPPGETYSYINPAKCAVAQYLEAHGIAEKVVSVDRLDELDWNRIVCGPQTFGRAARKASLLARNDWLTRLAEFVGYIPPRRRAPI